MIFARLLDTLDAKASGTPLLIGHDRSWDAPAIRGEIANLAARLNGRRVLAVLADNGPAWIMADLAALKTGLVHLPLPGFFSPAQLAHALEETAADVLLTDQPERATDLGIGFAPTGSWNGLVVMERSVQPVELPADTAKVSFTSGSTGTPKGVCLGAAGLLATARAVADRLADLPIERHLCVLPLALLLENVAGVYAPLLRGTCVHVPALQSLGWRGMAGFDPAALQQTVATTQAQSLILVPELAKAWSLYLAANRQSASTGLLFAAVGGARVDQALLVRARELGLPLYQGYGLTECGSVVSLNRPGDDGDGVGRPLAHADISIRNGEVVVSTPAFLGYLGMRRPSGEQAFKTGDTGALDAHGHLHLAGRRKHLLITSYGRNIAPEWIEAALLAQPAIGQAVVTGDGRPWLAAILVPGPGASRSDMAAAVARVNRTLPDYARIVRWLESEPFTPRNGLGTGNGRPVRQAILQHHAATLTSFYASEEMNSVVL